MHRRASQWNLRVAAQQGKAQRARQQRQRGVDEPPHQADGIRPYGGSTISAMSLSFAYRCGALVHSATRQGWSKGSDDAVTS